LRRGDEITFATALHAAGGRAPRAPACRCSAGRSEPQENLMPVLLRNATADGSGPVIHWPGGAGTFWIDGIAADADVTLERELLGD
jgi:hypothetical protein